MIRKFLASCAALALACSPGYAAGWYPGFTGTGQVAPTGTATATPTQTASGSCNSTGGYVGLGDCQGTTTIVRHYGLRAMSYQAAQLGVYVARVYGDSGTGDASTAVYADVRANTDGTPNFTSATLASGSNQTVSIAPGAGTATTNPCFGGEGKCRIELYDQQTQVTSGAASNTVQKATRTSVTALVALWQNCSNYSFFTVSVTRACFGELSGVTQTLQDTSIASTAQPYSLMGVFQKASNDTGKTGFIATGTLGTNGGIAGTATAGTWTANAGTGANLTVSQASAATVNVLFNSASGTSLAQVNGTNSTLTTVGSGAAGPTLYLFQNSGGNVQAGVQFEVELTTGVQTAAQMGAAASNQSAYYGLGF